jgi:hypothetical protein
VEKNPDRSCPRGEIGVKELVSKLRRWNFDPRTFQINTDFRRRPGDGFSLNEVVVDYACRLKKESIRAVAGDAYANDVSTCYVSPRIIKEGGYEAGNS